uniref:Uncharacterized protein n=1 Tax=Anguilla anguilla TaxID=7936 RepID=A0A0E9XYV4_ANGAN
MVPDHHQKPHSTGHWRVLLWSEGTFLPQRQSGSGAPEC